MVAVTGTTPLAYQWQLNGVNIAGTNSSMFTTPVTSATDDQSIFSVVITNPFGSAVSNAVTLTVNTPPTINQEPAPQTVAVGESASFYVITSGTAPLHYQWSRNGVPIPSSDSPTYTTPTVTANDSGSQFSVIVSNTIGSAPSTTVGMTVIPHNSPATYYVDAEFRYVHTNDGISKDMPWQNAPGMSGCSYNCAAYLLQPGDRVIFKGGVSWVGDSFPLIVTASGTSANPIYYGVDSSWYSGNTWTRPADTVSAEGAFCMLRPVLVKPLRDFVIFR